MTSPPASAATTLRRGRTVVILALRLAAVATVGWAQASVDTDARLSTLGFAIGAIVFALADRLGPAPEPAPASRPTGPAPRGFWGLYAPGCVIAVAAGAMVHRQSAISTTQLVWAAGMLLLVFAAARSWWASEKRPLPTRRSVASAIVLLALATALYAPRLDSMPPEMHGDEAEEGMDAVALLHSEPFNLFTAGWYELPRFHVVRLAAGMKLFGINAVGLRSSSVLVGALTVVLLAAVGRAFLGFEVGGLAALLLVSARFFVHLSRTGISYIDAPFFSILTVWFFTRMLREPRLGTAVWCGIALGLGMQSYFAVRLVPVLLVATWGIWTVGVPRTVVRERARWLATAGIAAFATVAPMIGYFWGHWDLFWSRTRGTSIFSEGGFKHLSFGYQTDSLWRIIQIQAEHTLPLFNRAGDTSLQYGFAEGGLFEPVTAALFVLGLGAVLARPCDRRHLTVLLWAVLPVVLGGLLTIDAPFYPRLSGAVPFAALMAALGLHRVLETLLDVAPRRGGRVAQGAVAAATLAAVFANNIRSYFFQYAPHHIHGPAVPMATWIRDHCTGKTTYMLGEGFPIKHGTVRFLAYGCATADVPDVAPFLSPNRFDPRTSLFIVVPDNRTLLDRIRAVVGPLRIEAHRNQLGTVVFYSATPERPGNT